MTWTGSGMAGWGCCSTMCMPRPRWDRSCGRSPTGTSGSSSPHVGRCWSNSQREPQAHDQTGLPIIVALEATDPGRLRWTALAVLDDTDTVLDTDDHKRRWHAWLYWTNLTQFLALGGGDGVQLAASAAAQFEVDVLAMDLGESLVDTARRETAEETGVQVQITGLVGIYTDPKHVILYTSNGEVRQEFSVVYTARPIGGAPTPSDESREVRWVAPADVASLPMDRSMWMRIAHYLAGSETPHLG